MSAYDEYTMGEDGWTDWIEPIIEGYKIACCDCGLVHAMNFRVEDGRAQFMVRRNNRSTGQMRRHMRDVNDRLAKNIQDFREGTT